MARQVTVVKLESKPSDACAVVYKTLREALVKHAGVEVHMFSDVYDACIRRKNAEAQFPLGANLSVPRGTNPTFLERNLLGIRGVAEFDLDRKMPPIPPSVSSPDWIMYHYWPCSRRGDCPIVAFE